jgi:hypothetical protein
MVPSAPMLSVPIVRGGPFPSLLFPVSSGLQDKIYFTSTLIAGAGCGSDTFRAWRNRNGLFPETSGGGKWNKFSVIDILIAGLVSDLTRTGVSAQLAVDAAMKAVPLLEKLFDVPLTKKEILWPSEMLSKIEKKIWPEKADDHILVLRPMGFPSLNSPKVELLTSHAAAQNIVGRSEISIIVNLRSLCRVVLASMAIADSELEIDGTKRVRPGHAELKSRAARQIDKRDR